MGVSSGSSADEAWQRQVHSVHMRNFKQPQTRLMCRLCERCSLCTRGVSNNPSGPANQQLSSHATHAQICATVLSRPDSGK